MSWLTALLRRAQPAVATKSPSFQTFGGRRYYADAPYLLPKDGEEINRLDLQHYMLRYALHSNFIAPISQPATILDVGCGTGQWVREMAVQFPQANVVGLDLLAPSSFTAEGDGDWPGNSAFMPGDVVNGLPFADASFDFVHQRLLVGALPASQWPAVVRELARVARPGGWIELVEAAPVPGGGPALQALREWLVSVCQERGLDPLIGPKIGTLLRRAGLDLISFREARLPLGAYGDRLGELTETNFVGFISGIRGLALTYGLTDAQTFDQTLNAARAEIAQGRYTWPYFVTYGQKPA